jgi:hypothetical protein
MTIAVIVANTMVRKWVAERVGMDCCDKIMTSPHRFRSVVPAKSVFLLNHDNKC